MKTMKYFLSMAALALVGAMTVSCSSDDNIIEQPQQPETKNNVVTLTTTVGFDDAAGTRALTPAGVKTFGAGDQMAVIYKNTSGGTVKHLLLVMVRNLAHSPSRSPTLTRRRT